MQRHRHAPASPAAPPGTVIFPAPAASPATALFTFPPAVRALAAARLLHRVWALCEDAGGDTISTAQECEAAAVFLQLGDVTVTAVDEPSNTNTGCSCISTGPAPVCLSLVFNQRAGWLVWTLRIRCARASTRREPRRLLPLFPRRLPGSRFWSGRQPHVWNAAVFLCSRLKNVRQQQPALDWTRPSQHSRRRSPSLGCSCLLPGRCAVLIFNDAPSTQPYTNGVFPVCKAMSPPPASCFPTASAPNTHVATSGVWKLVVDGDATCEDVGAKTIETSKLSTRSNRNGS